MSTNVSILGFIPKFLIVQVFERTNNPIEMSPKTFCMCHLFTLGKVPAIFIKAQCYAPLVIILDINVLHH